MSGKYNLDGIADSNEEGLKSSSSEDVASANVDSGGIASWLLENVWNPMKGGIGPAVGATAGGIGGGMVGGPPGAWAGAVGGSGVGRVVQDYLTQGQVDPSAVGVDMLLEGIGGPLMSSGLNAGKAILRRTPGVNTALESGLGLVKDLKEEAYRVGTGLSLPKTLGEIANQQESGLRTVVPSVLKNRSEALQNIQDEVFRMGGSNQFGEGGMGFTPESAEQIRALVGTLRDSPTWRKEKLADPMYKAIMNDLRDEAAMGNVAAQRLLQANIEINSLNALKSGVNRLPMIGAGGMTAGIGIGMGLPTILRHPGMAAGAAISVPGLVSGANMFNQGVKNFNPYAGAAVMQGGAGLLDYWRNQQHQMPVEEMQ